MFDGIHVVIGIRHGSVVVVGTLFGVSDARITEVSIRDAVHSQWCINDVFEWVGERATAALEDICGHVAVSTHRCVDTAVRSRIGIHAVEMFLENTHNVNAFPSAINVVAKFLKSTLCVLMCHDVTAPIDAVRVVR